MSIPSPDWFNLPFTFTLLDSPFSIPSTCRTLPSELLTDMLESSFLVLKVSSSISLPFSSVLVPIPTSTISVPKALFRRFWTLSLIILSRSAFSSSDIWSCCSWVPNLVSLAVMDSSWSFWSTLVCSAFSVSASRAVILPPFPSSTSLFLAASSRSFMASSACLSLTRSSIDLCFSFTSLILSFSACLSASLANSFPSSSFSISLSNSSSTVTWTAEAA